MRVFADALPVQDSITAERGIGRYVAELAGALETGHPEAVDRWVTRADQPMPAHRLDLLWSGKFGPVESTDTPPEIWHATSPFEDLAAPLDRVWPRWARGSGTRLVVTLYDLIPLLMPELYLAAPGVRAAYLVRIGLVSAADRVLAISRSTADDATRLLGVPPSRIEVVGAGAGLPSRAAAGAPHELGLAVPPGYLLYVGGFDHRKNLVGLITGYSLLPAETRSDHRLVIVCRLTERDRADLGATARALGVEGQVDLIGWVTDDQLASLYAHTSLFVFPSLYEGFGLPVVEAAAGGAPLLVGDNSALAELVDDPRGRFAAHDPVAIAEAIGTALADDSLRDALRRPALASAHRWADVADRVVGAYRSLARPRRHRPHLWLVSPMPPVPSGVADYSAALLRALARHATVDVFAQEGCERQPIAGVRWFRYSDALGADAVLRPADLKVFAMGNSEHHAEVMRLLRRIGGVAVAHDVRYTGLLGWAREHAPDLVDPGTARTLDDIAHERRPDHHAHHHVAPPHSYYMVNALLTAPALQGADLVLVHSTTARMLAQAELGDLKERVRLVPFGHRARERSDVPRDVVVSLGVQHWTKGSATVCAAFCDLAAQHPDLHFAMVGRFPDDALRRECDEMVTVAGCADRVHLTGWVSSTEYDRWLARAVAAVQLREYTSGESSAAVADCLGAGVPVITTRLAAGAELAEVCELVDPGVSAEELSATVHALLDDPARRVRLGESGRAYAASHSYDTVAAELVTLAEGRRPARLTSAL